MIVPIFDIDYYLLPLSVIAFITTFFLLIKKNLALYLSLFFIFSGTLFSVDVGFTFKAAQFFSLFSIINLLIIFLKNDHDYNKFKPIEFAPFLLFIVCIIPSLGNPHFFSEFYERIDPVKLFFNYLFLQVICFSIAFGINTEAKFKKALKCILGSFLMMLGFGCFQQIFFYLGLYNPELYIGSHQLILDFYGPFYRFAPGTFANEFGEITQTILIFLTLLLYFFKKEIKFSKKFGIYLVCVLSSVALVLNFTRISWIIFAVFLLGFLGLGKTKISTKVGIFLITFFIGVLAYFLYTETNLAVIVSIFDRFSELSELSGSSAGTRLEAWNISLNLFMERPLTGHGLGVASETHNVPIQLLAETGVQGLLGFYFLMFYLLNKFFRMTKNSLSTFQKFVSLGLFYSLIGCLIFDLTNHGIYHFILWTIIGLGLALEKIIPKEDSIQ